MEKVIAIRREDKNQWERRTPITPEDVKELKEKYGIRTIVQPSSLRIFPDQAYREAGAEIREDLSPASLILAVKEIPVNLFEKGKTYMFFSHTIKGQPYNMDMLRQMINLDVNLIDYERIMDDQNRRLIFFGHHAGLAGMIETLHAFGQKLKLQGFDTPFSKIKQAYEYPSLEAAKREIRKVGSMIEEKGLPYEISPIVVGFAGYGNVSRGAQEIFDLLPIKVMSPSILKANYENFCGDNSSLYKIIFKEEDLVKPLSGKFNLQDYYDHPEKYTSQFYEYIRYLKILVNCIYWTDAYPRLITKEYLRDNTYLKSNLNLRVIGDISCDINGAIEITHKATMPDNPCYTYFADKDRYEDGVQRLGVTVMSVDNLPCEFSRESSVEFSSVLKNFVNDIVSVNFKEKYQKLNLPEPIRKALILHNGRLTEAYSYMKEFLK